MNLNEENLFNPKIVLSIFRRKQKVESNVLMPFEDCTDEVKNSLLSEINLALEEQPILLSFIHPNHWLVMTTRRLIWCKNSAIQELAYKSIQHVNIDREALMTEGAAYKRLTSELKVVADSTEFIIDIGESGGTLFAFISALEWVVLKSKGF